MKTSECRELLGKVVVTVIDHARSLVALLEDEIRQPASSGTVEANDDSNPALETLYLLSEQVETLFHVALEVRVTESALSQERKELSQLRFSVTFDEEMARLRLGMIASRERFLVDHDNILKRNRLLEAAMAENDQLNNTLRRKASQFTLKSGLIKSQVLDASEAKKEMEAQVHAQVEIARELQVALKDANSRETGLREELHDLREQLANAREDAVAFQGALIAKGRELESDIEALDAALEVSANDLTLTRAQVASAREAHETITAKL